ncbi:MAG TPA: response regulator transcription factor [Bryobacteraceae bacterium]|jgi:two-component system KDP operon response regulator KdpE|nr:response regulator transcription factor [Bryobacteraceae bacterium]
MKPQRVLLYEEDSNCELLRSLLCGQGCEVQEAPLTAGAIVPVEGYCLVVFDIQRLTGLLLNAAHAWREAAPDTMLVVLASRTTRADRIALLESGIDACLRKPLVVPELRARVRAALRRFRTQDGRLRRLSVGQGTIDLEARQITATGRKTRLTPTECGILEYLVAHLNQTVPRNELVKTLWGSDPHKGAHSLRLFIRRLRQKLEPDPTNPRYLVTDPSVGYRLQIPAAAASDALQMHVPK